MIDLVPQKAQHVWLIMRRPDHKPQRMKDYNTLPVRTKSRLLKESNQLILRRFRNIKTKLNRKKRQGRLRVKDFDRRTRLCIDPNNNSLRLFQTSKAVLRRQAQSEIHRSLTKSWSHTFKCPDEAQRCSTTPRSSRRDPKLQALHKVKSLKSHRLPSK